MDVLLIYHKALQAIDELIEHIMIAILESLKVAVYEGLVWKENRAQTEGEREREREREG